MKSLLALPRAYSAILFLDHAGAGLLVLAATLWFPNIGLAGLVGAVVGLLTLRLFHFADGGGLAIFNSLLVGLSLGAFYQLNAYVVIVIVLGAVLAVMLSVSLAVGLWRMNRLPALSLPFILVVLFTAPVARRYSGLGDYLGLASAQHEVAGPWLDGFFSSLGSTFFSPQPLVGLVLFAAILWRSRYLALLALGGYAFGQLVFTLLTDNPPPSLLVWSGFNFMLTAMAVAGFFTVPSRAGVALALLAVAMCALLVVATQDLLLVYGLPVLAIPFVLTVLIVLSALSKRSGLVQPWLAPQAGLPEVNYERARLAQVRNGEFNSVPLLPPFFGAWEIYQGFDGPHTHRGLWRHALDFYLTEEGRSFANEGARLEDFYGFGLPVLSPANGQVARCFDKLADNVPGEVDTKNNWGNFILIRLDSGLHVLLAHLRQDSIKVQEGDRVKPGEPLAACGNSGRSPQPHLHLQVQREALLGSPTVPFHLTSVLQSKTGDAWEYRLVSRPDMGERVQAAQQDEQLASQLHLPVGRTLRYRLEGDGEQREVELRVELTLLGQFRLVSDSGASAAFEEVNGVLAFYDRQGPADILLDCWLLANGLTPLSGEAHQWQDAPAATLLPLSPWWRVWLWLWRPLGCGLRTSYQRQWDELHNYWLQKGKHQLQIGRGVLCANSESVFEPLMGCTRLQLTLGTRQWRATLLDTGQVGDRGVPGWRESSSAQGSLKKLDDAHQDKIANG